MIASLCVTSPSHTHLHTFPTTTPAPTAQATNPRKTAEEEERLRDGARSIVHFKLSPNRHALNVPKLDPKEKVWEHPSHHSVWTKEEVDSVQITHLPPADVSKDWVAGWGVCMSLALRLPLLMSHHHLKGGASLPPYEHIYSFYFAHHHPPLRHHMAPPWPP